MERYSNFTPGNYYHIYNRGVNKQKIFYTENDCKHFQTLLYTRNSTKRIDSVRVKGVSLHNINREDSIVDIIAYALMPNHFHLLVYEKIDGGISRFMRKLGTAHAMHMNTKYQRSGPLMCRPFRSKHVDGDKYLKWLFNYIHLNPCELDEIQNVSNLVNYHYSSFIDYYLNQNRTQALIIESSALPHKQSEIDDLTELQRLFKVTYE